MTSSISSSLTLDNLVKVNQLSDTAMERIKETFSAKDSDVEEKDNEIYVESEEDLEDDVIAVFDYSNLDSNTNIADYIKRYTSAVSNYLTYLSENKVPLGESQLKDVVKNNLKVNISRSAYNDVGMSDYYSLKQILNSSQFKNSYSSGNNIIKNLTNFTISV